MIGAAVVLVLGGLIFPITMLFAAVVFDLAVVAWVFLHEWHDHWSGRVARIVSRPLDGVRALGHRRPAARPAH